MKHMVFIALTFFYIQSLSGQINSRTHFARIDMAKAIDKKEVITLSRFVENITFIPLETTPETVLDGDPKYEVTDDFIIIKTGITSGRYQILLFDRSTGRFIREIGKQGRGPDQYLYPSEIPFNKFKKEVYALGPSRQIMAYDLSDKLVERINNPEWKDVGLTENNKLSKAFQTAYVHYYSILDTNVFVGYAQNFSGFDKRKVILFSKTGFLKIFPNYLTYNRKDWSHFGMPPGQYAKFYIWDNDLNFIEAFCDTLYYVTKNKLIPRYYFNFGKYKAAYSKQLSIFLEKHIDDYSFIYKILENKSNIFLELWDRDGIDLAVIDKGNNTVKVCKKGKTGTSGLKDDIYGMPDVVPLTFTEANEMVYAVKPSELIKWSKDNFEKAARLIERFPWLREIDPLSNTVIAIAKCKN